MPYNVTKSRTVEEIIKIMETEIDQIQVTIFHTLPKNQQEYSITKKFYKIFQEFIFQNFQRFQYFCTKNQEFSKNF